MSTYVPDAKNAIRRCLHGVVDPYPSRKRIDELWAYFNSSCAYCGQSMDRKSRQAHRDHLISSKDGGGNDLGNTVLACGQCNGDEKRDMGWVAFLRLKNPDAKIFRQRKRTIENWIALNADKRRVISAETRHAIDAAWRSVCVALDAAVAEIKELRSRDRITP